MNTLASASHACRSSSSSQRGSFEAIRPRYGNNLHVEVLRR
jgi:hypothetical protein